ncbi:MAG: hypothetical protein ACRCTQ_06625 [Brevinemataceae bacterium]
MIIIVYNEEKTITRILSCSTEEDTLKLGLEHYKIYEETNAYIGLNLDFIDEQGMIKSDKRLLEENVIQLQEDQILDGNKIRKLTIQEKVDQGLIVLKDNEEIRGDSIFTLSDDEMKEKFPDRYPSEEPQEEYKEDKVMQAIREKNNQIYILKDEYIDADIDGNESLKAELRKQIQESRKELVILKSKSTKHNKQN